MRRGALLLARAALILIGAATAAAATETGGAIRGFGGVAEGPSGFAEVVPGHELRFPRDHGAHPGFRVEWWYLTANLTNAEGQAFGLQWTLFRQAMAPPDAARGRAGWATPQLWMAHAAVTSATRHLDAERFARGGVGQAGVVSAPFAAWLDDWRMAATPEAAGFDRLSLRAAGDGFSYDVTLSAGGPLVLQGDAGYSLKADRGAGRRQASYYVSQPFFRVEGRLEIEGAAHQVAGQAWLDREWSSHWLEPDQTGWDWVGLHLDSGAKLMLFRLRRRDGGADFGGNWIAPDGRSTALDPAEIRMAPTGWSAVAGRRAPTSWRVELPSRKLRIDVTPLNPQSWMNSQFPYWEGPVFVNGTHHGRGYLELTGY